MNIKKHGNHQDDKASSISNTLEFTLREIAAKLPKKEEEEALLAFKSIAASGNLPQMNEVAWVHPAGAEDESCLTEWKLLEEGNDKFMMYPDELAAAILQVDSDRCLVPALDGGWSVRLAKKFSKNDVVMQIDGDWKKKKPETNSGADCADVYWCEDFTRASLGRISMRYYL